LKEGTLSEQEGQGQCKAYPECENDPEPGGVCVCHQDEYYRAHPDEAPPGLQHSSNPGGRMTIARYNEFARRNGLDEIFLAWDSGVISRRDLTDANRNIERLDNRGH